MIYKGFSKAAVRFDSVAIFLIPYLSFVLPFSDSFTLSFSFLFLAAVCGLFAGKSHISKADVYFIFVSISLFLIVFVYSGSNDYSYGFSRFLSLSLFILNVIFLLLTVRRAIRYNDESILLAFYYGLVGAVLVGIVDFFLFVVIGKSYFPINFFDHYFAGVQPIYGFLQFGSDLVYRPGGLSGEPKTFGMFSVSLLILCSLFYKYNRVRPSLFFAFLFSCVGILLSGSTSALVLALIFVIFYFFSFLLTNRKLVVLVSSGVLLLPSLFYYYLLLTGNILLSQYDHDLALSSSGIFGFINSRLLSRIGLEDFDYFSILSISREYFLFFVGNGGFLGNLFLNDADYVGWWLSNDVNFSAKSGFIFAHSLMGIFVIPFLTLPILQYFSNRIFRKKMVSYGTLVLCILVPLLFFLRSYMLFSCIVLWCAVMLLDNSSGSNKLD